MLRNMYHREGDKPEKVQDISKADTLDDIYGFREHDPDDTYLKPMVCGGDDKEGVSFCKPMYPHDMIENNSTTTNKDY